MAMMGTRSEVVATRRAWRHLLAALVAFALVAAACGDDDEGASDGGAATVDEGTDGGGDGAGDGDASDGDFVVALSNSFIGNDWRKTMVDSFEAAAEQAVADGRISEFRVEITAENTATAQIASIESLILAGVDALVINSASPTALDPVIQSACDQGIVVVVFDSLAEAPCAYKVANDFADWGRTQAQLVLEGMGCEGNLILVEGVVGSAPNETVLEVWDEELAACPDVEIVAEVVGENSSSTTQQAIVSVLPSLPEIDGVLLQVGADGVINAFQSQDRPLPIVDLDTSGATLQLWKDLNEESGFETSAVLTDPGQGSAALQVAIMVLHGEQIDGQDIPLELTTPLVVIRQSDLDAWLTVTPPTEMAHWTWSEAEVRDAISTFLAGEEVPAPPIPSS